jgi:hypothetical protein
VLYQMAVSELASMVRSSPPYHSAIVMGLQVVVGSSATTERLGSRIPLRRGLPL